MNSKESSGIYIFQGNSIVVPLDTPDSQIDLPIDVSIGSPNSPIEEISRILINTSSFDINEIDIFTIASLDGQNDIRSIVIPEGELPVGWKAVPLRQALNLITGGTMARSQGTTGRILRSYHIAQWRKVSRYCGNCGGINSDTVSVEVSRQCSVCGKLEFPRISPAVIVLIINDKDEIVLAHNKNFSPGIYSLIAGFNEAGESLEETVAREIKEEINLKVKDIRYIYSQPWPFPDSLMLGFSARYDSGEIKPDGVEIEDAGWFSRDNLPALPGGASLSRYLINLWLE